MIYININIIMEDRFKAKNYFDVNFWNLLKIIYIY